MPAITGTAVTPTNLLLNLGTQITFVTATNTGTAVGDTQTFELTLTKRESTVAIIIQNFNATVAFTYQLAVGTPAQNYWSASTDSTPVTINAGATHAINFEGAKFTKQNSTVSIRITPTAGTALNVCARIGAIQLP